MRLMFFAWPNNYDVLLNCIKLGICVEKHGAHYAWNSLRLYICTLFQPLYTYDHLFVLHCAATWRHPGISRGLESEFILTNERPAHEPHRPIIILPHTFFQRQTIHPSIHPTITTHRSSLPELKNAFKRFYTKQNEIYCF
jgi:hypothetical protein